MIQRIQSIYFLLAAICFLLMAMFDIVHFQSQETAEIQEQIRISIFEIQHTQTAPNPSNVIYERKTLAILALVFFLGLTSLAAIGIYKNRLLQIKLSRLILILGLGLLFMITMFSYNTAKELFQNPDYQITPQIALFLPLGGILFAYLAQRGVKKDEALVRSADRIR